MKVVRDRTSRRVLPSSSTRSGAVLLGCSVARGRQTAVPDPLILPHVWGVVHRRTAGQEYVTEAADLVCPVETGRAAGTYTCMRIPRALSLAATTTGLALLLAACGGSEGVDAEGPEFSLLVSDSDEPAVASAQVMASQLAGVDVASPAAPRSSTPARTWTRRCSPSAPDTGQRACTTPTCTRRQPYPDGLAQRVVRASA